MGPINSILAFVIPYRCGIYIYIIMNKYHDRYHRKLREKLRDLLFENRTESVRRKKDILNLIIND